MTARADTIGCLTGVYAGSRPRWRGRLHAAGCILALACGVILLAVVPGPRARVAVAIYTGSACSLFGTSALYNGRRWSVRAGRALHRLDHSMILVLIAGTYAPIALLLLRQPTQSVVLAVIAATTGLGIALRMIWLTAARALIAGTYVACSSAGVVLLPVIANRAGFLALALVLGGGLLYIAGATVYARRRPDPAPAIFGYHEVFHLLTIAAAAAHCAAIVLIIYSAHPPV